MNDLPTPAGPTPGASPWWREPMMWLVVGGPALVVAACALTITLALKYPDPVLKRDNPAPTDTAARGQQEDGLLRMPAHQARNHTATPAAALPRADD